MRLYVIDEKAKQIAKMKTKTETLRVPEKVVLDTDAPTDFIAPISNKYRVDITATYDYRDSNLVEEVYWEKGTHHKFVGYAIDNIAPRRIGHRLMGAKLIITQLASEISTTIPAPPIPRYDIYQVKDRKALPYKALLANRGGYYRSLVHTTQLGWCA